MRSMARSSSPEEGRKLGVTNVSNDDEGFEEISHAVEGNTSRGSQGDEDMPDLPHIGDITPPSFLDKDDDFVDEPLNSSPRLNVRDVHSNDNDDSFEDPELMVPPLSPTKKVTTEVEKMDAMTLGEPATNADEGYKAGEDAKGKLEDVASSRSDHSMEGDMPTSQEKSGTEQLDPRPEDTPAPLFSNAATSTEASSADVSTDKAGFEAPQDMEVSEVSVNAGHSAEQEETSTSSTGSPVVGDYLKMQFVENEVVPTILSFFFRYPWNNFLHNVVYDIVQQVFNGPMDRGYNSVLAISLFEQADITAQIIKGQQTSELSQARTRTRMGYMGHLTLIAEEVVKFTDRHPPELLSPTVLDRVMAPEWSSYVDGALAETRERDNAILGGVRPEVAMNRSGAGGSSLAAAGLANIGLSGLAGGGGLQSVSSALAEAGLDGGSSAGPFAISAGTLMSGFGSSSDEDDDEEQDNDEDVHNEVSPTGPNLSLPRVRPRPSGVSSGTSELLPSPVIEPIHREDPMPRRGRDLSRARSFSREDNRDREQPWERHLTSTDQEGAKNDEDQYSSDEDEFSRDHRTYGSDAEHSPLNLRPQKAIRECLGMLDPL